jgi:hypothetical protein
MKDHERRVSECSAEDDDDDGYNAYLEDNEDCDREDSDREDGDEEGGDGNDHCDDFYEDFYDEGTAALVRAYVDAQRHARQVLLSGDCLGCAHCVNWPTWPSTPPFREQAGRLGS